MGPSWKGNIDTFLGHLLAVLAFLKACVWKILEVVASELKSRDVHDGLANVDGCHTESPF